MGTPGSGRGSGKAEDRGVAVRLSPYDSFDGRGSLPGVDAVMANATSTVALWLGPFALLALGSWLLFRRLRQRKPEPPLTEAERSRAAKLLE